MTQFRSNTSGSQFWLRNVAHNSMLCARTSSHLASVTAGQRSALTRQPLTLSQFTKQTFSNRSARRLELPESYRKQTTAPLSNRHKFTHTEETSATPRSPSLECGIAPAALPFNPASPRGSLGQTSLLCRLSPCTLQLQRPPQVANATRDHGACLTQWAPSEAQSAAGATQC